MVEEVLDGEAVDFMELVAVVVVCGVRIGKGCTVWRFWCAYRSAFSQGIACAW